MPQKKKALRIAGIQSVSASFLKKGTPQEQGAQIDLLLDRSDQVINIFEIKFSNQLFSISKSYFKNLSDKLTILGQLRKPENSCF